MGLAAEITQHLHGSTEGGLGIDDPVVAVQASDEVCELQWIAGAAAGPAQQSLVAAVETFQSRRGTCRERRG